MKKEKAKVYTVQVSKETIDFLRRIRKERGVSIIFFLDRIVNEVKFDFEKGREDRYLP